MRPGQQQQNNKQRMRGRNNNNGRKGPNPLSRSFESNGPDVKIRGTAQHIADKYTTLARDAAASGDRVMAENYLQHAEHYGRIVAAAQGQFQPSQPERDYTDEDDDALDGGEGLGAQPAPFAGTQAPQHGNAPRFNDAPRQDGFRQDGPRQDGQRADNQRQDNFRQNDRDGFREGRRNDRFGNRENGRDGNRGEGGYGRGENAPRDVQQRPAQGTGPQPYPRETAEGGDEAQAPVAQDGRERREGRRDRQRFNDRSGERRFEERFGRQRGNDERAQGPQPVAAEGGEASAPAPVQNGSGEPQERAPVAAREAFVPPVTAEAVVSEVAPSGAPEAQPSEGSEQPRRRGRPRRDPSAEVHAEQPSGLPDAPSTVSAGSDAARDEAAAAEPKRRAPRAAAPESVEADAEAAPKRRPGRPRKKKPEDDDGEVAPLPDFLLASNN